VHLFGHGRFAGRSSFRHPQVTRANKVAKESFDSTADQLADDLLKAAKN